MRFIAVLVVGAVAVLAARLPSAQWDDSVLSKRHVKDAELHAKRTYHYAYDGQIATGIPQASEQHAAQRVQAHVAIYMKDQKTAVMEMRQIRMGTLNKEVSEPREVLPFRAFEEQPIEEEYERVLRLPVRFVYESGLVRDIEFDQHDQIWAMNMKRAVLNLLQVNLKKEGRTDLAEQKQIRDVAQHAEHIEEFFAAQEKTIEGECEAMYTMLKKESGESNEQEQLEITKSVNFDKCAKRADLRYNLRFAEVCPDCEKQLSPDAERVAQTTSVMTMNVTRPRGQTHRFIVKESELRAHYAWAPMRPEDNIIAAYSVTRLHLVKVEEQPEKKPVEPKAEKKEQLLYNIEQDVNKERFYMENDDEFVRQLTTAEQLNKVAAVEKIVAQLVKDTEHAEQGIHAEAPHHFARLVQMLRICKSEEVTKIVRKFVIDASKELEAVAAQKARDYVIDALAQAGTKTAFEEIAQLIKKQKMHALKAAQTLKTMMNTPIVGDKHAFLVVELCEQLDSSSANPAVRQSCWLTAGALAGQVCRPSQEKQALEVADEHHKRCTRETKKRFMAAFERLYEKAQGRYEKVLALKTIANSGIDLAVFPLEKIISSPTEPKVIRIAAIDALRLLRTQMPRKMHHILMPIFKNQYENPEVRMNALHQLLETLPERAVLEQIADQLRNERSHQVHSFVHTALTHYANSTMPCERRMADDLQVVLRAARVQPRRLMDSRLWHKTLYCNTYKMGVSAHAAAIFGNNSFIPKELTASFNSIFAGEWNKYVAQIGFYQENLDEVVAKLIEQLDENTITEVLRAQRSTDIKPAELLKKLQRALNIERRSMGESRDAHAMLYVRVKDLDYAVVPLDKQSLAELARRLFASGRFDVQQLQKELARGFHGQLSVASFNYESIRKMPTAFGAPITVTSKLPLVAHIKAGLKTELNAAKAALKLSVQGELKVALTHITHVDIATPLASVGTKVLLSAQIYTPLHAELEAVAGEKLSTRVSIRTPETAKRVLSAETRPLTYVRMWPRAARHYIEPVERTIVAELIEQQSESVDFVFGERATGVRARLVAHWPRRLLNQPTGSPFALLAGHNSLQLLIEPTETTPKQWTFRVEADAVQPLERMEREDEAPELDAFYEKRVSALEQRDLMRTEDYESSEENENVNSEEEEQTRRTAFLRHARSMRTQKGLKSRITFRFEAEQSPVERRARASLTAACERRLRFCKWTLEAERTPFTRAEQQKWTLRAVGQMLYPELALTLRQLKDQPHREFTARLQAEWGTQGELRQTFEVRVQGEQNAEQQRWMRLVEHTEKASPLEQIERMTDAAQLNQYKMTATYRLTRPSQRVFAQIYEWTKARLFWSPAARLVTLEPEQRRLEKRTTEQGVEGELVAVLTVSPRSRDLVNLTVETPYERVQLVEARLPIRISPLNIRREFATRIPLNMRQTLRTALSAPVSRDSCTVKATRVSTFDDVIYKAPLSACWQQIAADCSSEERFNILIKRTEPKSVEMTLKVITKSAELLFQQIPGKNMMKISANGEELNVEKYEVIAKYGIMRLGENFFELTTDDFEVAFDGFTARVHLARQMRALQCGLCGNYDGEKEDEFRTAQNELTDDLQTFHKSYLYTKEECNLDESMIRDKKNYEKFNSIELETSSSEEMHNDEEEAEWADKQWSSEQSSSNEQSSTEQKNKKTQSFKPKTLKTKSWRTQQLEKAWYSDEEESNEKSSSQESYEAEDYEEKKRDTIKPVTRTHVLEKTSEVCFSTKPVKTCPKETFEQKTEKIQVEYVCVPRDHSAVRKLLAQARQTVVPQEKLARMENTQKVERMLEQPRLCVAY